MPLWGGILEYLPFYVLALVAMQAGKVRRIGSGLIGQSADPRPS
jgi:hypothetical protein